MNRFDRTERVLHWVNGTCFTILIATGAALYLEPLDRLIGRRALIEQVHVWTGVALPIPVLLAVAGPWGRALRADITRWNRWSPTDLRWLRSALRRGRRPAGLDVGKFNAGQKLNSAFIAGAGLVMLATGAVMRWSGLWPLAWRTGATFVHDWLALAVVIAVVGHTVLALSDPEALRSMVTGRVSRQWAACHAPAWLDGRDDPSQARLKPATGSTPPVSPPPGPSLRR